MSRTKLLLDLVTDLNNLAETVQEIAEVLASNEESLRTKEEDVVKKDESRKEVTLEEVRTLLAQKSQAGFTAEIKKLLRKYHAIKLSEIDPKHYVALMEDAEELK
ncbi:rRNA biogenesis protein rrp5 [Siminovitchia sp. FSL H7-0308]|uniref:rRNA biogenesis protein rrp5 n=1 Tax=Siminovitchia sp. FSL H7-0308 TaxID=2921432 RepID=UPI0030EE3C78